MTRERWKSIKGFEGRYQVSTFGNVRSIARCFTIGVKTNICIPERAMALRVHTNGYIVVWLRKPGIHRKHFVHRLVAAAFLPNPDGKTEVNHKNRNRLNNMVVNLEWLTPRENKDHWRVTPKVSDESEMAF